MIANQTKGQDARGCLDYVMNKEGASLIGGNIEGSDVDTIAKNGWQRKPKHKSAFLIVYHASLSVKPTEKIDDKKWCNIASDYLQGMGFVDNAYVVVKHSDTEHNHIHIVANRTLQNGKVVSDKWEYGRARKVVAHLEEKYDLERTQNKEQLRKPPTTGEIRMKRRTGEMLPRDYICDAIDEIAKCKVNMPEFLDTVKEKGIEVKLSSHLDKKGRETIGISYSYKGIAFAGWRLGSAYTFNGLQKHHRVGYERERDYCNLFRDEPLPQTHPPNTDNQNTNAHPPNTDNQNTKTSDLLEKKENQSNAALNNDPVTNTFKHRKLEILPHTPSTPPAKVNNAALNNDPVTNTFKHRKLEILPHTPSTPPAKANNAALNNDPVTNTFKHRKLEILPLEKTENQSDAAILLDPAPTHNERTHESNPQSSVQRAENISDLREKSPQIQSSDTLPGKQDILAVELQEDRPYFREEISKESSTSDAAKEDFQFIQDAFSILEYDGIETVSGVLSQGENYSVLLREGVLKVFSGQAEILHYDCDRDQVLSSKVSSEDRDVFRQTAIELTQKLLKQNRHSNLAR